MMMKMKKTRKKNKESFPPHPYLSDYTRMEIESKAREIAIRKLINKYPDEFTILQAAELIALILTKSELDDEYNPSPIFGGY